MTYPKAIISASDADLLAQAQEFYDRVAAQRTDRLLTDLCGPYGRAARSRSLTMVGPTQNGTQA